LLNPSNLSLMAKAKFSQPNIYYVVNKIYQFIHSPYMSHWSAILRNLQHTIDYVFMVLGNSFHLPAFTDSYWLCWFSWSQSCLLESRKQLYDHLQSQNTTPWLMVYQSLHAIQS
jgi:hypothetical protein